MGAMQGPGPVTAVGLEKQGWGRGGVIGRGQHGSGCKRAALGASSRSYGDKQESELGRRGYAGTVGRNLQVRNLGT